MHLVIATPFYPPSAGILAHYAAGIEGALTHKGHRVTIVLPDAWLPGGVRHFVYGIRIFWALRSADSVLALDTWSVGVPAAWAARAAQKPFLVRIGGDFLWEHHLERTHREIRLSEFYTAPRSYSLYERLIFALTKSLLSGAHAIFFNTTFQKDIWEKAYGIPPGRATLLENFYPPRVAYVPPTNHVFVSAHRGAWYKNVAALERAVNDLQQQHPGVELVSGILPHAAQLARIAQAYAVIIPSISEVGSNTVIEAVSLGRPFIMTDDTGSKERLGACGIFVDTRTEKALREGILKLLDPAVYSGCVANIRQFSFTHSWDEIADEILHKV